MTDSLNERVGVVTGSSRGLGRAIALEFARHGANIVVNYKRMKQLAEEVCQEIEDLGGTAVPIQADVTDPVQAQKLVQGTFRRFRRLDILVNNAGITRDNYLLMMSNQDLKEVMEVNLDGVFHMTKAAAPIMAGQRHGVVINIGSGAGLVAMPGQCNYSAAKAGLLGFSRSAARELIAKGVRVLNVAPGFFKSEMSETLTRDFIDETLQVTPLGRWGLAEELAVLVGFLASDGSAAFNGHTLVIDGGRGAVEQEFGFKP